MTQPEPHLGHIHPPWDQETVNGLNRWQSRGVFHPFTCENGHDLVATPDGWVCWIETCGYTQDWAWAFMVIPDRDE